MRRILTIAVSLAMVGGLASCQKVQVTDNKGDGEDGKTTSITATFSNPKSKVAYMESGTDLRPEWENGDIVVGICDNAAFELKVASIKDDVAILNANGGSVIPEGNVTLFYKKGLNKADWDSANEQFVVNFNGQKGDKTMPAIMMARGKIEEGCGEFIFDNSGAVLGIYEVGANLKGKTIKQVTLYGKKLASSAALKYNDVTFNYPANGFNVISTEILSGITVGTGDNGTLGTPILMAVPAGAEIDFVFIRTIENEVYSLASTNKEAMAANNYRYIKGATFVRAAERDNVILTGVFSVKNGEEPVKQVFFSKGNLIASIDKDAAPLEWRFATNQYDCIGEGGANEKIGTGEGDVDLFDWSTDGKSNNWGILPWDGNVSGNFNDWGKEIDGGEIWRTLSEDEWKYLFNTRIINGSSGLGKTYSINITYGGQMGVVLYPDNYSGSGLSGSVDSLPEGVVFLPAAGYIASDSFQDITSGKGAYWSSTAIGEAYAFSVNFDENRIMTNREEEYSRGCAFSVRLVTLLQ